MRCTVAGLTAVIVSNSVATQAKDFDAKTWLGQRIEQPQPALGGRKPDDFLDAASRLEMVAQVSQTP